MLNKLEREKLTELGGSRVKANREYLLRSSVAGELNTYLGWDTFNIFNDIVPQEQIKNYYATGVADGFVGAPGIKSIFNKYGAVPIGAGGNGDIIKATDFRINNNVPLIDSPENRKKMRSHSNCTIRELVEASQTGMLGKALYAYSDFMYCKYLGSMPNNYLITLRRFPMPVDDYISTIGIGSGMRKELVSTNSLPIGTMVTWMNTPGNEIENILTYSVKMPFEEKTAYWEQSNINADNSQKPLNAIAATFDKTYRQQYQQGYVGSAINGYVSKVLGSGGIEAPYSDLLGWRDKNKIYGPVDAVKKTYYRSESGGIDFDQNIKLTFEYEIRSYNGINGRQAMLDLISNILQVTYTTGTFWGGGYYGAGAHQNNIFANLRIMNENKGFSGFVDSFFKDASDLIDKGYKKDMLSWKNLKKSVINFFNDLGGMLAGGLLNKLGRPQKAQVNSLLSPAPTGFWHLTIGNPFHPIMSLGNMILKETTITHSGPLGIDDFPTNLKVECTLERGKPRDLRGIEMIYMNGNDRVYYSMGKEISKMYEKAKNYKQDNAAAERGVYAGLGAVNSSSSTKTTIPSFANILDRSNKWMMHFFGTNELNHIIFTAEEQEFGSQPKDKK